MRTERGLEPHEENSDDKVCWQQIKNDESSGLETLYVKYTQELFRLGMAIKADRNLVKDCIQDVFFTIWRYRHSIKGNDNVKLYLFKCLSNKIHKEIGKEKKKYSNLTPEIEERLSIDPEVDLMGAVTNLQKRKHLQSALESLPGRQQEVLHLLYYENHSYEDICIIMGINVQSAYSLAWKAIANLKKRLLLVFLIFCWC
ncbi:RNA polymerase sigma factor, sigma-70 family [Cyclobacterium lianum]|uniref:RNA polymerase sigma factor, sigma-70 family n=1 Tax=Cyclobacterium lianum TaxID=388280 RepID=A0A1M7QP41_9BACT|nr:sigma-70 family RNA polymerase sigma factor [Cyclobacterium lianum]SHN33276.1 RNA polymerase sigma factor, sigma-70 family [Cyclobacterium lianum]